MVKKYQLKNGLKVLLIESHKSPVVSVQMWVNTGSADERKGEEGISHFIEHLVFKGTQKFAVGEIAKTVEGSGGELNAYTSFDQTVFYVTISKNFTRTGLEVISQMMGFPKFDEDEINKEREVVIEEIKRSNDSPHRQASRALFETIYKSHPYGLPVIGHEKIIREVTVKKLKQYYSDRYSPSNMTLLIAGDINKDIKNDVEELFGKIPKTKVRRVTRKKERPQRDRRIVVKQTKFQESFLYLTWPGITARDKQSPALDTMSIVLGQGESSRLVQRLRNERALVTSIGAGGFSPKDKGLFALSMTLNHDHLEESLKETMSVLTDFLSGQIQPQEMAKAIRAIESEKYYSMQTVDGLSQLLGSFEFYFGNPTYFDKQLKSFEKLKATDVLKEARKRLNPKNLSVIYLSAKASDQTKEMLKNWCLEYEQKYKHAIKGRPAKQKAIQRKKISWSIKNLSSGRRDPKLHKLSTGVRALVLRTPDSPVVNVKCAFMGGLRAENPKEQGVNELLSRVWTSGTTKRSEAVLNEQIDSLAARVSAFGGRNTTGLSMTALKAFALDTFDIYKELMTEPLFSDEAIEREKRVMLEQLKNRDDNPAQICILNMMRELFGPHPYHRDPLGTTESVSKISRSTVRNQHEKINRPENLVFSVVGDVDTDAWLEQIESLTKKLNWSGSEWPPIEKTKLTTNRESHTRLDREQTHIVLAYPGLTLTDQRRRALDVMQAVLAGQGGRLFIELRDKESLAYSVSPIRFEGIDGGYFGTYIGCSPEKKKIAIQMMRAELDKLCQVEIPEEELTRAKRYIIGKHDISLQKGSAIASEMLMNEMYGLPFNEYLTFANEVKKVTSEEIRSLASHLFSQPNVLSIVGKD